MDYRSIRKQAVRNLRAGRLVVEDGVVKVRWEDARKKYEAYFANPNVTDPTVYVTRKGNDNEEEE